MCYGIYAGQNIIILYILPWIVINREWVLLLFTREKHAFYLAKATMLHGNGNLFMMISESIKTFGISGTPCLVFIVYLIYTL